VKRPTAGILVLTMLCALPFAACNRQETAATGEVTETIAPATPQPAPTGTDAMTQTVDIEAGRTDAEGGVVDGTATDTMTTSGVPAIDTAGSPPPASATTTR
jgi:hypothetical protein